VRYLPLFMDLPAGDATDGNDSRAGGVNGLASPEKADIEKANLWDGSRSQRADQAGHDREVRPDR
jgi:hypothetical protein